MRLGELPQVNQSPESLCINCGHRRKSHSKDGSYCNAYRLDANNKMRGPDGHCMCKRYRNDGKRANMVGVPMAVVKANKGVTGDAGGGVP